jgi:hypothetical protein
MDRSREKNRSMAKLPHFTASFSLAEEEGFDSVQYEGGTCWHALVRSRSNGADRCLRTPLGVKIVSNIFSEVTTPLYAGTSLFWKYFDKCPELRTLLRANT